jgi:hypothetical protein
MWRFVAMQEIIGIILIGALTLFISYKLVLFFADEKKRKAKKFFEEHKKERRECEKHIEDIFHDHLKNRNSLFNSRLRENVLPAIIALVFVGVVNSSLWMASKKQPPKSVSSPIAQPAQMKPKPTLEIEQLQPIIEMPQKQQEIYSWIDKNGVRHYENTQPATTKTNSRETPIIIENNQIFIPVVIGHNGKAVRAYFLLDTGCSVTLLHDEITEKIQPDIIGRGKSTVADGRQIESNYCRVDFIQVGPFTENNFTATTYSVERQYKHFGLLGMGFLAKHPFQIDMNRNVIHWL